MLNSSMVRQTPNDLLARLGAEASKRSFNLAAAKLGVSS
jgi:hypothetical protein